MPDIIPTHLPLSQLLNGRLFEIPDYQRAYSWTSRERRDLFDDIENIHRKGSEESHFMATIVCLHRQKVQLGTDEYDQLDVVDGQQRLTTIILILNSIKLALDSTKPKERRVFSEISELLVKVEGDNLLLRDPLIFCFSIDTQLIEHVYRSKFLTMLPPVNGGV